MHPASAVAGDFPDLPDHLGGFVLGLGKYQVGCDLGLVVVYLTLRKRELLLLLAVCRLIALDLESLVEKLMIGDVQIDISRIDFITWHSTLTLLYFPPHGTSSTCGWASYSIMSIEKDSPFRKLAVSGCDLA